MASGGGRAVGGACAGVPRTYRPLIGVRCPCCVPSICASMFNFDRWKSNSRTGDESTQGSASLMPRENTSRPVHVELTMTRIRSQMRMHSCSDVCIIFHVFVRLVLNYSTLDPALLALCRFLILFACSIA